jgi:ABC-type transport system substrate-binding protein
VYEGTTGTTGRQLSERFQSELEKIGIKVEVNQNSFPELSKKLNQKKAMVWGMA